MDREFKKSFIGSDFMNTRDSMLEGDGYGPLVLEEIKKISNEGFVTGNLFVKYLYQPTWYSIGSHGGPERSVCTLIEVSQFSLVIKTKKTELEFKNASQFNRSGEPSVPKLQLDSTLCPKL